MRSARANTSTSTREELEAVAIESKRTIEIDGVCPEDARSMSCIFDDPYYIAPDGEVGQQAFAVIREAIRKEGMVALGKVVFTSREHIIALEARDKGMLGITLRYPYEVRTTKRLLRRYQRRESAEGHVGFGATHSSTPSAAISSLRNSKISTKMRCRQLIERKQKGEKIEQPKQPARSNVVNLMDALRASVEAEGSTGRSKGSPRNAGRSGRKMSRGHSKHKKAS